MFGAGNKITASPSKGEVISMLDGAAYELVHDYTIGKVETLYTKENIYMPKDVVLSWKAKMGAGNYIVRIGTKEDLSDAKTYETTETSIAMKDLFAGTHYYYQVEAVLADKNITSEVFDFVTEDQPRTIYIEGVSNTRDIGGYKTEDGKYRVRQGMIYRGAAVDEITADGKKELLETYGIKTDLDLRGEKESSPLGDSVNFVNVSGPYYAQKGSAEAIFTKSYQDGLREAIRVFTKEENYPVYMHCQIGRDRTGTLTFLINSLLGVGEQDLYKDYELSFLSESGCTDLKDGVVPSNMIFNSYASLFKYVDRYKDAETLAEKTEMFMLDLGITEDEIAAIKSIMLEEIP